MNRRVINLLRIVAVTEFLLGLILLSNEIINYAHLPTTQEINNQFGGLVEWFRYKESCYKNFFLYLLLIITGVSFWMNKRLYWGLTQVLLITLFFVIIINLWFMSSFRLELGVCLVTLSLLIIFIYLEIKMCNLLFLQTIGITKTAKYLYFFGGGLSCVIWLVLS